MAYKYTLCFAIIFVIWLCLSTTTEGRRRLKEDGETCSSKNECEGNCCVYKNLSKKYNCETRSEQKKLLNSWNSPSIEERCNDDMKDEVSETITDVLDDFFAWKNKKDEDEW